MSSDSGQDGLGRVLATAVSGVARVVDGGAYADLWLRALRRRHDPAFARRVERLVLGTLERYLPLVAFLEERYLERPLRRLPRRARHALLVASYALLETKLPAAVVGDRAVALAEAAWARRVVNAVLRRLAREGRERWSTFLAAAPPALRYGFPAWWADRLAGLGEPVEELLAGLRHDPGLTIWPAPGRDPEAAHEVLIASEVEVTPTAVPGILAVSDGARFFASAAYTEGWYVVQDANVAAWLRGAVAEATTPLWDAFCAPGGKLLRFAGELTGLVVGSDRSRKRLELVRREAERIGIQVPLVVAELPAVPWRPECFATVILDVPCTASGTVGRHPEVPLRVQPADLARLAGEQLAWLRAAATVVRPGGRLWYCTCSVFPEENEHVVAAFLAEAGDRWRRLPVVHPLTGETVEVVRFWPHRYSVGAGFVAQCLQCSR